MKILLIISGIAGGILGGMGMGGGTLFIPMLTLLCKQNQIVAQSTNLISFLPMATISIIIHTKNKLIKLKTIYPLLISGIIMCIIGSMLAPVLGNKILKKCFGIFLIIIGIYQFVNIFTSPKKVLDNN